MNKEGLVYIVGEFPSHTETFIRQEIQYMHKMRDVHIIALKKGVSLPDNGFVPNDLRARVIYLPYIFSGSLWISFFRNCRNGEVKRGYALWKKQKKGDGFFRGLKLLLLSGYLSDRIPIDRVMHIHAHFAGFPTSLAMQLAALWRVPFSFTAHAHDIYVEKDRLEEKIVAAAFVVTCTMYNKTYLEDLSSVFRKIHLVYHGVDLERWKFSTPALIKSEKLRILMIGRLVKKKGTIYLLEALRRLKGNMPFECVIVGGGNEFDRLYAFCKEHGLTDEVIFTGWQSSEEIEYRLRHADIFVLPAMIASDGDRDGLPNVLLEAMACGVAVVSTRISAIPELITHCENGWLVPEKRADKLVEALMYLHADDALRMRLAAEGRLTVEEKFDKKSCNRKFSELFN